MTNRIAVPMGLIILALILLDVVFFGGSGLIFLGKKMFDLGEWMAFWR